MSSFQGAGIEGVPLYTEVCSFHGVGIEEFHCIQGVLISGSWNRGSSIVYRGVLILGGWNRGSFTVSSIIDKILYYRTCPLKALHTLSSKFILKISNTIKSLIKDSCFDCT